MRSYNLGFISDKCIFELVQETVARYRRSIDLNSFNRNIVDPIKLTFDAKIYNKSTEESILDECFRQIDKSNSNMIGFFHQQMFRYAGEGWEIPQKGFDVQNRQLHIYGEIKNKHNTMNSASSQRTYMLMQDKILKDDQATCYLIEVIARKSQDTTWRIRLNNNNFSHERIRRISMDKFYEIAFGDNHAFMKLCQKLPQVLDDVLKEGETSPYANTVLKELEEFSPNIYKAIYLLAFERYEGFDKF